MNNDVSQVSLTPIILVDTDSISSNATPLQATLFDSDGAPITPLNAVQIAAQTDAAAMTSSAAVAAPTKAEYDALRNDVVALRTVVNSFLAKARTSGVLDS